MRLKNHPGSDPGLDMTGLGDEPDLSFLECLMPWSGEFKGYCGRQEARLSQMIASAVTRDRLGKNPVSENGFKRILGAGSKNAREEFVREGLKEAAKDMDPVSEDKALSAMGNPARDVMLPEKRKPFFFTSEKQELSPAYHSAAGLVPKNDSETQRDMSVMVKEGGPCRKETEFNGMLSMEIRSNVSAYNTGELPQTDSPTEETPCHPANPGDFPQSAEEAAWYQDNEPILNMPVIRRCSFNHNAL